MPACAVPLAHCEPGLQVNLACRRRQCKQWWGQQYAYLVNTLGMDMIWQDMTCPAITNGDAATFPLALMVSIFGQSVGPESNSGDASARPAPRLARGQATTAISQGMCSSPRPI